MRYDFTRHHVGEELGTVWVNGEEFRGIGYNGLLTVNTKTYVSEPTRANDGSMPNINDHETFIVPRCKVNFKYMSLSDYQRLCNAILPNEFVVKYYDKQLGDFVEHYMYAEPEEMAKIYNVGTSVIGVLDYEVSFIGTLNKLQKITVQYDLTGETIKNSRGVFSDSATYTKGERVKVTNNGQDKYYEAIYEEYTFTNQTPPNATYWQAVTDKGEWSATTAYEVGQIAYATSTSSSGSQQYYECLKSNTGASLSDSAYWKAVAFKLFSDATTYTKGDYVYVTGDSDSKTFYKAIYYVNSFKGIPLTNIDYWKELSLFSEKEIQWGKSIVLDNITDLFETPYGKTSGDKWKIYLPKSDGSLEDTGLFYFVGQNISVLRSMVLKAYWVDK